MRDSTGTEHPIAMTRQLTAQQFLNYFLHVIAAEADFTEMHNEDHTLGDYLADLSARCERTLNGEIEAPDPLDAAIMPTEQWVRGRDIVASLRGLCGCPETDNPEYVRGAWEVTLDVLGVPSDDACDEDGSLGGPCTEEALIAPQKIVPVKGPIQQSEETAAAVIEALGFTSKRKPTLVSDVARIIREKEARA